jgi:hypothetical protein
MKNPEQLGFCRWGVLGKEVGGFRDRFRSPEAGFLTLLAELGTDDPDFLDGFQTELSHVPKGFQSDVTVRLCCTHIDL